MTPTGPPSPSGNVQWAFPAQPEPNADWAATLDAALALAAQGNWSQAAVPATPEPASSGPDALGGEHVPSFSPMDISPVGAPVSRLADAMLSPTAAPPSSNLLSGRHPDPELQPTVDVPPAEAAAAATPVVPSEPVPALSITPVEGHPIDPTPPSSSVDVPVSTPRVRSSRLAAKPPVNYNETQLQKASLARAQQGQPPIAPKPRARRASLTGSEPDLGRGPDDGSALALPMQANSDSDPGLVSTRDYVHYSSDDDVEIFAGILREDLESESDLLDLADPFGLNDLTQFPPLALPAQQAAGTAKPELVKLAGGQSTPRLAVEPEKKKLELANEEAERFRQAYAEVNQLSLSAVPPLLTAIAEIHEQALPLPAALTGDNDQSQVVVAQADGDHTCVADHRLSVDAALDPYITHEAMNRFVDGRYRPAEAELSLHDSYFSRRGTTFTLAQPKDIPAVCMRLFNPSSNAVLVPSLVLADTGADLTICISPAIATTLGMTWTDNKTLLRGIGGSGGTLGRTHDRLRILLGGSEEVEDIGITPFQGCFSMYAHAIVLSPQLVQSLGHRVILGATFLRNCLATFDPVTETMEYAPAFMSHQCLDLRCRVPCQMSEPYAHMAAPMALADSFKDTDRLRDFLGDSPLPASTPAVSNESQATPQAKQVTSSISTSAKRRIRNRRKKSAGLLAMPIAAPATPGFPQDEAPPSREQYKTARAEQALRNREQAAEATARILSTPFPSALKQAQPTVTAAGSRARPLGVVYDVDDLRRSGRLLPSLELDLGAELATKMLLTQVRQLEERVRVLEGAKPNAVNVPAPAPLARPLVPARLAPIET